MKKLISAIFPVLGIVLTMNYAYGSNYDYAINQYNIDLNFKKNNTVSVSENINAEFYKKSNSMTRTLMLVNSLDPKKHIRTLNNVKTNDIHVISPEEFGYKTIKIVDTKNQLESEKDYSFKYDLTYDKNLYSQDFSYDIIDGTWDEEIDQVNFKIVMPYDLKNKKVEFISSSLGIINNDNLDYSILKNTITGHYTKTLLPNEALTLHITPKNKNWFTTRQNQLVLTNVKDEKITLYENDEVIIRLNSNPTTGFTWQMSVDPEDENIVSISDETYIPNKTNSKLCGSGGISEFKVKAHNKGEATITGVYIRPWMKYEDTDNNSVQYTIEVK